MAMRGKVQDFLHTLRLLPYTMFGKVRPGTVEAQFAQMEKLRAYLGSAGAHTRFLPFIDNYSQETSEMRTTYRKMVFQEPSVKSAFLTKILSVASLDLTVQPASKSPRDKNIARFVKDAITRSRGGVRKLVQSILIPGCMDGHSVTEKLWTRCRYGEWKGFFVPKDFKSKDTQRLYLEGDDYRNITAVVDIWNATSYHPDNFIIWQHLPLFENPLGTSDFRAAYRPYWLMTTAWQLRAIAMERFGLPFVKGTYSEASQRAQLEASLAQIRGQSWITIPEGAKVEVLTLATRGTTDFEAAIADLRKEVYLAICGSYLFALEGTTTHGAGDTSVHQDITELLQWALASEVDDCINGQLVPDLIRLNVPGDVDLPRASLGAINLAELKAELDIDTGLSRLGLKLSQDELYEKYRRKPPDNPQDALIPPAPGGPGGGKPPGASGGNGAPEAPKASTAPGVDKSGEDSGAHWCAPGDGKSATVADLPSDKFCGGKGSGKPGPCPTNQGDRGYALHKRVAAKVVQVIANRYRKLEGEFGRPGAIAILGATVALTPVPVPGTSLAPLLLAKGFMWAKRRFQGHAEETSLFGGPEKGRLLDNAEAFAETNVTPRMVEAVRQLIEETYQAAGETPPTPDDAAIAKALRGRHAPTEPTGPEVPAAAPFARNAEGPAVAGPKTDREQVERFLAHSVRQGVARLGKLATAAIRRQLAGSTHRFSTTLFDEGELRQLAEMFAEVLAPAELLGRAQLHLRKRQVEKHVESYAGDSGATRVAPEPLNLPDIRQTDHYSCGAAAAMAVGRYFGVGPETLPEWKKALGTNVEKSTDPQAIVAYLQSLGLSVEAKAGMTLEDLKQAWLQGCPVICPVQDYGPELPGKAKFAYGHYLTVIGFDDPYVICQDSSQDNAVQGSGTIAAPGRVLIPEETWMQNWHDQDADGNKYVRFGIVVGSGATRVAPEKHTEGSGGIQDWQSFAETSTDFSAFDEKGSRAVTPMAPQKALDYFTSLVPELGTDPKRFGERMQRHAFTMAEATSKELLKRVQNTIAQKMQGRPVTANDIQDILDGAGIHPKNPYYAENVLRTNTMDAYTEGLTQEMRAPGMADFFPAWAYRGIWDGRQRPTHEVQFDRYFPNGVSFAEVRDAVKGDFDGFG